MASRTASETWSAILSGCPSVTDSEVNRYSSRAIISSRRWTHSRIRKFSTRPIRTSSEFAAPRANARGSLTYFDSVRRRHVRSLAAEVAVPDERGDAELLEVRPQRLHERDRAVPATGAADRHRQIRLALALV